jgi:uncharacterized double-CXXCG motif protein
MVRAIGSAYRTFWERMTSKIYRVLPDDSGWRSHPYRIDAKRRYGLPGLSCDACGQTWITTGLDYPAADLSALPNKDRFADRRPVGLREFRQLADQVQPLIPAGLPLAPASELGPLIGKARGPFAAISWLNRWTPVCTSQVADLLRAEGDLGSYVQADIRISEPVSLWERQIEARVHICGYASIGKRCDVCGLPAERPPGPIAVDRRSIPESGMIFRVLEVPTRVVATERFVSLVESNHLSGVAFEELSLA